MSAPKSVLVCRECDPDLGPLLFSARQSESKDTPDSSLQGWAPRAQRDAGKERTNLKQQIKSSQLKGKHGAKITPVKFLMSY